MLDPLGAEITGGYKPPRGCWKSNLHAWEEELGHLTRPSVVVDRSPALSDLSSGNRWIQNLEKY